MQALDLKTNTSTTSTRSNILVCKNERLGKLFSSYQGYPSRYSKTSVRMLGTFSSATVTEEIPSPQMPNYFWSGREMNISRWRSTDSWRRRPVSGKKTTSSCVCWLHLFVVCQLVMSLLLSDYLQRLCRRALSGFCRCDDLLYPIRIRRNKCLLKVLILKVPDMSKAALWATSRAL